MRNQEKSFHTIRWVARIWGTLVLAFVLFFLIAHLFGVHEAGAELLSTKDKLTFLFFPLSTLTGLAIAWKWEGTGGSITVLGMIGLLIIRPNLLSAFWLIGAVLIPGLMYMIYWYQLRKQSDLPKG